MNFRSRLSRFLSHLCGWMAAGAVLTAAPCAQAVIVAREVHATPNLDWRPFSLTIVNGRPALAWLTEGAYSIRYARALDANGTNWPEPLTIGTGTGTPPAFGEICLRLVNDHPAICYLNSSGTLLSFHRALDPWGATWSPPVVMATGSNGCKWVTMEVVEGNPAIGFAGGNPGGLRYVRATYREGSVWGGVRILDSGQACRYPSMRMVQGRPAIAYGRGGVQYLHASDAAGGAWNAPISVYVIDSMYHSLELVDNFPAIGFFSSPNQQRIGYLKAGNLFGLGTWAVAVVGNNPNSGDFPSMAVIGGSPAFAFRNADSRDVIYSKYSPAGNSWQSKVTVEGGGDTGLATSLLEVNGQPAIGWMDSSRGCLKFARASTPGTLWPPELKVELPVNTEVVSADFGGVRTGSRASLKFTLRNINAFSAPLTIQSFAVTGPHAAEFFVVEAPVASTLNAGDSTTFTVRHAPLAAGEKSALLQVTTNSESAPEPYAIRLSARSFPDMSVERTGGPPVKADETIQLPATRPGTSREHSFTVRNPGSAELSGLAIALTGPDSAEFMVTAAPEAAIPPGGSTTFTLRHTPVSAADKQFQLRISNNLGGNRNPYILSVRTLYGAPDSTFTPGVFTDKVLAMALRPNGRILLSTIQSTLISLKSDGSVDPSFFSPTIDTLLPDDPPDDPVAPAFTGTITITDTTRPEDHITCIAVQNDGRILIGGGFTRVSGHLRPGLARIEPDGTLDHTFVPALSRRVTCLAIQRDGRILAATDGLDALNGVPEVLRLRTDGSLDPTFKSYQDRFVTCLVVRPDGSILAGGRFGNLSVFQIDRLDPDGTPHAFASLTGPVTSMVLQPDGRVLAGGQFTGGLIRFNADGTPGELAVSPHGSICTIALQTDGTFMAGWSFETGVDGEGFAKILSSGERASSYAPNLLSGVRHAMLQADGKPVIAGNFSFSGGFPNAILARLDNDPAGSVLLRTENRSTVRWLRSGSAPEVHDVVFYARSPGSSEWKGLGYGTRISGGWELKNLKLPSNGNLRAHGRAGGSVIEDTAPILPPLESWRLQYFHSPDNAGDSADDADPDHDGLTNFTEYAFGLRPVDRASSALPEFKLTGTSFTATFMAPDGREEVIYAAEYSATMLPGSWTNIPDTGTGGVHEFRAPATGVRTFVRYSVKMR